MEAEGEAVAGEEERAIEGTESEAEWETGVGVECKVEARSEGGVAREAS